MATPAQVRAELKRRKLPYNVEKTQSTWYVTGADSINWIKRCLYTNSFDGQTAQFWVDIIEDLSKNKENRHWSERDMKENIDHEEDEPRSYMAYRNLHDIYENVEELLHMLDEDETLEDWIESKITTAKNAISDVYSAIRYDKHRENEHEDEHEDGQEDGKIIVSFGEWVKNNKK